MFEISELGTTSYGHYRELSDSSDICLFDSFAVMGFGCSSCMNPPSKKNESYQPALVEQIANIITHGVFVIPALIAVILLQQASFTKSSHHGLIAWIYGVNFVLLFAVSTTFHIVCLFQKFRALKGFFHLCDRGIIYFFIAASYMPWLVLRDLGQWGSFMSPFLWSLAVMGTLYNYIFHEKYKTIETVLYLMIGIFPSIPLVFAAEDTTGLFDMVLGGAFYVSGVAFFKSDGHIPFAHAIWHLFCASGAWCHFYAVYTHLYLPRKSDQ